MRRRPSERPVAGEGPVSGQPITPDDFWKFLHRLEAQEFFGECTLRMKGGKIYQVALAQTITAKGINNLNV